MTMARFFDRAADWGCDAVEPTSYFFPTPVSAADIARLRRHAHLNGLDISSAAIGNDFSWPVDSERGQQNLEYTIAWIERMADLSAPTLRVFAARKPPTGLTKKQLFANVTANLSVVLPHAERCGMMLGLENHDLVRDPELLLSLVEQVDSPWLGICWDSGNLLSTPTPYAQLEKLAPWAVTAQVKATIPRNGDPEPSDYGRLASLLRSAGYAGYLVLEYEEAVDPVEAIPEHLRALREAIQQTL